MSSTKLHAYKVLLRLAHIKSLRAQAALANAVGEESKQQKQVEAVTLARDVVGRAARANTDSMRPMDIARYELLTKLDAALSDQLHVAMDERDQATAVRLACAMQNLLADRYRERVDVNLAELTRGHSLAEASKMQEDNVERWLSSREAEA